MRRSLVLEILEHLAVCGSSLVLTGLFVPYGQGLGRAIRDVERKADSCPHDFSGHSGSAISVTLSRLKKRGFVSIRGVQKKVVWQITVGGRRHFVNTSKENLLPPKDGKIRLVIYDIPEGKASQRAWLRNKLAACDYAYLQKSVWLGTRPLPKDFQKELRVREILSCIHVVGLEGFLGERAS